MSFFRGGPAARAQSWLLQTSWRQLRQGLLGDVSLPTFVPVQIAESSNLPAVSIPGSGRGAKRAGLIEIELGSGRRIRVDRDVDADALRRVLEALAPR